MTGSHTYKNDLLVTESNGVKQLRFNRAIRLVESPGESLNNLKNAIANYKKGKYELDIKLFGQATYYTNLKGMIFVRI
ncbi:35344_t:CDS:2 [Gigaspora margarita]|uniref:35344_t:CDS:1 n=1 Tax=Gigaspora margarita TaxID=4874 RepID=A0ABM8VYP2_GIGMA|nr:35344_t:CDS:2 [Gigaspora margarita]